MNKPTKTATAIGAALATAAVLGLLLTRADRAQGASSFGKKSDAVSVRVGQVQRRDVPLNLTAIGTVQSMQSVLLRSQIDGVLTRVLVSEGQSVRRGQLLAQIDDRAASAALQQAMAARARDRANLQIAQLNLTRDQNLLKGEAISRETVDEQSALVEQLGATVSADDAAIQAAQVQLSYTRIVSPVSGRVGIRRVDAGNVVHAADTNGLFSVVQVDPISVLFSLPQQDLSRVLPLLSNPQQAPVQALDRDLGTTLATGKLTAFDNQVDTTTGTFQLRAVFTNHDGRLLQGQFVTAQLTTSVDRGALVIDQRAVLQRDSGTYVFKVANGHAQVTPVSVRYQQDGLAAIGSGLQAGDVVVIDGQSQLTDHDAIRIVSGDSGDAASSAAAEVDITP
jgi:RND family efflux transporter MFP subunit